MRLLSKAKLVALAVIASAALMDEVHHPDSPTVVTGEIGVLGRESVQGVSGLNFRMKMFNAKRKTTIEYENVDKAVFFNDQENLKKGTPLQITLTDESHSFPQVNFSGGAAGTWAFKYTESKNGISDNQKAKFAPGTWDFEFLSVIVRDDGSHDTNPQDRSVWDLGFSKPQVIVKDSQRRMFVIPEREIKSISIGAVHDTPALSIKERARRVRVLPKAGDTPYSVLN